MQALIYDIKHFAVHDGPGIRTTIFWKGCPLRCLWCHNPESQKPCIEKYIRTIQMEDKTWIRSESVGRYISPMDLFQEIRKDEIFYQTSSGGVTFSGGEPLMQPEALIEVAALCRQQGIHVTLDTCGHASSTVFQQVMPYIDLVLYDIKHTDSFRHLALTGVDNQQILENLKYLYRMGKPTILRFPVVSGCNDERYQIEAMRTLLQSLKSEAIHEIDLLPYHALAAHKYQKFGYPNLLSNKQSMTSDEVQGLKTAFEQLGYGVKIGG